MPDSTTPDSQQKALFAELVLTLSSSALQQLGKLATAGSPQRAANLEAAQLTIDWLEMLKAKTRGNLDAEEEALLNNILSTLQLAFVEAAAPPPAAETGGQPGPAAAAPPPNEPAPAAGSGGESAPTKA